MSLFLSLLGGVAQGASAELDRRRDKQEDMEQDINLLAEQKKAQYDQIQAAYKANEMLALQAKNLGASQRQVMAYLDAGMLPAFLQKLTEHREAMGADFTPEYVQNTFPVDDSYNPDSMELVTRYPTMQASLQSTPGDYSAQGSGLFNLLSPADAAAKAMDETGSARFGGMTPYDMSRLEIPAMPGGMVPGQVGYLPGLPNTTFLTNATVPQERENLAREISVQTRRFDQDLEAAIERQNDVQGAATQMAGKNPDEIRDFLQINPHLSNIFDEAQTRVIYDAATHQQELLNLQQQRNVGIQNAVVDYVRVQSQAYPNYLKLMETSLVNDPTVGGLLKERFYPYSAEMAEADEELASVNLVGEPDAPTVSRAFMSGRANENADVLIEGDVVRINGTTVTTPDLFQMLEAGQEFGTETGAWTPSWFTAGATMYTVVPDLADLDEAYVQEGLAQDNLARSEAALNAAINRLETITSSNQISDLPDVEAQNMAQNIVDLRAQTYAEQQALATAARNNVSSQRESNWIGTSNVAKANLVAFILVDNNLPAMATRALPEDLTDAQIEASLRKAVASGYVRNEEALRDWPAMPQLIERLRGYTVSRLQLPGRDEIQDIRSYL